MTTPLTEPITEDQEEWLAKRDKLKLKSIIVAGISSLVMVVAVSALIYANVTLKPVSLSGNVEDATNYISWFSVSIGAVALSLVISVVETLTSRSHIKKLGDYPGQRTTPGFGYMLREVALGLSIFDLLLWALMVYQIIQFGS